MGHSGPKNDTSSKLWIGYKIIFKILHNKRGNGSCYVHESFINCFLIKKIDLKQFDLFRIDWLIDWAWSKLSKATATIRSLNSQDMIFFIITSGSLNSQNMIRILKQSGHDFSDKHLCDGYCMDIMWCLWVEVKIQNVHMVLQSLFKNLLGNCFYCRGLEC